MVGVNRELMVCPFCNCRLPTSITKAQYLNHIQVKHMAVSEADMRSAWLHLEESRKANPRLLQVASLPQQTVAGFSDPKRPIKGNPTTNKQEHGLDGPELPGGPPASTAIIYKTVAEKNCLVKTIQQYQDMGKYAVQFHAERNHVVQRQLFSNLTHLAHIPDADQNMMNLPLPPGQTLSPSFTLMPEVHDEILAEKNSEEAFTCTASRFRLPVSAEEEEEEKTRREEVSGADVKDARCGGRHVSKKGEVSAGVLSVGLERETDMGEKISEAFAKRNAVVRIAGIGGRGIVVRKKRVSGKIIVAGKKAVVSKEAAPAPKSIKKAGNKNGDPKPVFNWKSESRGKRKCAKKVVGKVEVCSVCEFKGVLESKKFKEHLLRHYANDLREEFAEALSKKECPYSDHFKSDSRDGSHRNNAMLRHIGVTHGKVVKYHLLRAEEIKGNPQLKEARHP